MHFVAKKFYIGGVTTWRDAVDFIALGSTTIQVCTAAMVYGFKIVEGLIEGLNNFLDEKGMASVHDLVGGAIPTVTDWKYLNSQQPLDFTLPPQAKIFP